MIRHGSSCTTGTVMAHWPMTQRVPIPQLMRMHCTATFIAGADRGLTLEENTLIAQPGTLAKRKRLPSRTIPKSLYPQTTAWGSRVPAPEAFVRKRPKPFAEKVARNPNHKRLLRAEAAFDCFLSKPLDSVRHIRPKNTSSYSALPVSLNEPSRPAAKSRASVINAWKAAEGLRRFG